MSIPRFGKLWTGEWLHDAEKGVGLEFTGRPVTNHDFYLHS